jgi:hypothetical protein
MRRSSCSSSTPASMISAREAAARILVDHPRRPQRGTDSAAERASMCRPIRTPRTDPDSGANSSTSGFSGRSEFARSADRPTAESSGHTHQACGEHFDKTDERERCYLPGSIMARNGISDPQRLVTRGVS